MKKNAHFPEKLIAIPFACSNAIPWRPFILIGDERFSQLDDSPGAPSLGLGSHVELPMENQHLC